MKIKRIFTRKNFWLCFISLLLCQFVFLKSASADQNVAIHLIPDDKPEQISWNIYSYHINDYIYPDNKKIKNDTTFTISLHEGAYSVDCFDTRKNGGLAGEIFVADTLQVSWPADSYRDYQYVDFLVAKECVDKNTCATAIDYGMVSSNSKSGYLESGCEVWYKFQIEKKYNRVEVTTCGSQLKTNLEIWESCTADTPLVTGLMLCGYQSKANLINPDSGATCFVKLAGRLYDYGNYVLDIHEYESVICDSRNYGPVNSVAVSEELKLNEKHWYNFTTDGTHDLITVSTCGSDFDTKLEVWNDCNDVAPIAMSDDDCGLQESIELKDLPAGTYLVAVHGANVFTGNYILRVTSPIPPPVEIPQNVVAAGGSKFILLAWDQVEGATSYNIYQYVAAGEKCEDFGFISDCDGNCYQEIYLSLLGDGFCDDGTFGPNFNCAVYQFDHGDCQGGLAQKYVGTQKFVQAFSAANQEFKNKLREQVAFYHAQGKHDLIFHTDAAGNPVVSTMGSGSYVLIGNSLSASYKITELPPNSTRSYVVTAVSYQLESEYSAIATATTDPPAPGTTCGTALTAVTGENNATGDDQWFKYTATLNGYLVISSQNSTNNAAWDTWLAVYAHCDSAAKGQALAVNDNAYGYNGPSRVIVPVKNGDTYLIFWQNKWHPGEFKWTLHEKAPYAPGIPGQLTATVQGVNVILRWATVADAYAYQIYQFKDNLYSLLATVTDTTYSITSLDYNQTICAAVTAVGLGLESAYSEKVCATTEKAPTDTHFQLPYSGQPYEPMNVYVLSAQIDDVNLKKYDEIGIFNGELCVGRSQLSGEISSFLLITAAADNPATPQKDGFTAGDSVCFRFWSDSLQVEILEVAAVYNSGDNGIFQNSGQISVNLTATLANLPPIARAGVDQNVRSGRMVKLDGSGSFSTTGKSITHKWTGPAGITISNADSAVASFTVPYAADSTRYQFTLTVTDEVNRQSSDDVIFTVINAGCLAPEWVVNPEDYQFSMNITARLLLENVIVTDKYTKIAAFVGKDLRGVAQLKYLAPLDAYVAFLTIFSNTQNGEKITFQVWYDAQCQVLGHVKETYTFAANATYGTPSSPVTLNATDEIIQTIDVPKGWRWFSSNLKGDNMSANFVLRNLSSRNGDLIKGQTTYSQYMKGNGWVGTLDTLRVGSMYLLYSSVIDTLEIIGHPAAVATTPIQIQSGWNWLGYLPQREMSLGQALAKLNVTADDLIKRQAGYAQYVQGIGWLGSLTKMQPGDGYMLKAQTGSEFYYPVESSLWAASETPVAIESAVAGTVIWEVNPHQYQFNMTLTAITLTDKFEFESPDDQIAAFVGEECRGVAQPQYVESRQQYYVFLMIYSNAAADENISFRLYRAENGEIYEIEESVAFQPNSILGSVENPYVLNAVTGIDDVKNKIPKDFVFNQNYPNPFNPSTRIDYGLPEAVFVEIRIFNMNGQQVQTLTAEKKPAGYHSVLWNGRNTFGDVLPSGAYLCRIKAGRFSATQKIILLK